MVINSGSRGAESDQPPSEGSHESDGGSASGQQTLPGGGVRPAEPGQ